MNLQPHHTPPQLVMHDGIPFPILVKWFFRSSAFCTFFTFLCLTSSIYLNPFSVTFKGWNFWFGYFLTGPRMVNQEKVSQWDFSITSSIEIKTPILKKLEKTLHSQTLFLPYSTLLKNSWNVDIVRSKLYCVTFFRYSSSSSTSCQQTTVLVFNSKDWVIEVDPRYIRDANAFCEVLLCVLGK